MFKRDIIQKFTTWQQSVGRKPLVLRGARQTGKTTVVRQLAGHFSQYIYLNLETEEDKTLFLKHSSIHDLVKAIFFVKGKEMGILPTLIFIDEIQEAPKALSQLRYFYEEYPQYHVIAAGSLLESLFNNRITFPVGRVEYMVLYPCSFREYLEAMDEKQALQQYDSACFAPHAHDKLLRLFHDYTVIGGMPEVVQRYVDARDFTALKPVYNSLLFSYLDDVEKYSSGQAQTQCMRHAIRSSFYEAATRIKFQGFGGSSYPSREMGEALRTLEKAFVIRLIYPTTQTSHPFLPDIKKSPKLHVLDTGMLNCFSGIQMQVFGTTDLSAIYRGRIVEHIVGQELAANQSDMLHPLRFWVREKKESTAEVDYLFPYHGRMVPVEVKSGKTGMLRSLHQYMEQSDEAVAIRLYAGENRIDRLSTLAGKPYLLHSVPYYLAGNLEKYLLNQA
ncbi:MAG: AAA family ATPase [Prevotellaceae bacterium]|nr:AAA family ATPase [Prevotellaceae bacterium]